MSLACCVLVQAIWLRKLLFRSKEKKERLDYFVWVTKAKRFEPQQAFEVWSNERDMNEI